MHNRTLWLDLGNTRLKYWLTDEAQNILQFDAKEHLKAPNELLLGLLGTFRLFAPKFIGISSVLGKHINDAIATTLLCTNIDFAFARVQKLTDFSTRYALDELGVDRWLQMLGAKDFNQSVCVVGCGTALTIDLLAYENGQHLHLGGYIFPNVYLQRQALYAGTKQIDVATGSFHSTTLGTKTQDAVNHGILLSAMGAVSEVMRRYENYALILTGGGAQNLSKQLTRFNPIISPNLLLSGLNVYFNHKIIHNS